ncbi:MAG: hypothetical protein ACK4S4_14235 [Pyrinomonadaceae bacterium]
MNTDPPSIQDPDGLRPDPPDAGRFLDDLSVRDPREFKRLQKDDALRSDVATLAAYSPLLAATMLQNPSYISWLGRERADIRIRSKDQLLESLARFALTHSQLEPHDLLSRFRRRELLRVYLRDIRRLATVSEITEEISNLADAVLEYALRIATQEMDNRYGGPQTRDARGRLRPAVFCVVALGKLGSLELNYSSDIDLLFLYSDDGETSGAGSRGSVTNREYFVKLAEQIVRIVGQQSGEGAAYRIDLRLRPHGTLGALAISLGDAVRYYQRDARIWERQVLIRSRASAGDLELFREFQRRTTPLIYSNDQDVDAALASVRLSKQMIDVHARESAGYNVKLGRGGIREIEFIAQALQLAHGGRDRWLRASHTLISLSRLADRGLISSREQTELFNAYDFLRRLEHVLQMEHGLQTHTLPDAGPPRRLAAARMGYRDLQAFDAEIREHTGNVHAVFRRIFGEVDTTVPAPEDESSAALPMPNFADNRERSHADRRVPVIAPFFQRLLESAKTSLVDLPPPSNEAEIKAALDRAASSGAFRQRLAEIRRVWAVEILKIAAADLDGSITISEAKRLQTALADASVAAALKVVADELLPLRDAPMRLSVLGLGKLGGRGVDHGSDLDVVLVYRPSDSEPADDMTDAEFYAKAAELFITTLSGVTRDGNLYRVDLRLRPYGKNGSSVISRPAFAEYIQRRAAIWELLAYAKVRHAAGGEDGLMLESEVRSLVHARAAATPARELASQTAEIRRRLEIERGRPRGRSEIDIKYGEGGMLDIYFATRYLQLRDNIPDDDQTRATGPVLDKLLRHGSIDRSDHDALRRGYEFFSELDHHLRLLTGRTTRLQLANRPLLDAIAERMHLARRSDLIERLSLLRVEVRQAYENVVK